MFCFKFQKSRTINEEIDIFEGRRGGLDFNFIFFNIFWPTFLLPFWVKFKFWYENHSFFFAETHRLEAPQARLVRSRLETICVFMRNLLIHDCSSMTFFDDLSKSSTKRDCWCVIRSLEKNLYTQVWKMGHQKLYVVYLYLD